MIKGREIYVKFADRDVEKSYYKLREGKGEEKEVYDMVTRAIDVLKENPFAGIKIEKRLIPRFYIQKYSIDNLWKYDLGMGWRLLYTITGNRIMIVSIILEWMNHKQYKRRFGYDKH